MKFALWMAGGSVLAAVVLNVIAVASGFRAEREIWFGMLCPTLAAVVSWVLMAKRQAREPQDSRGMSRILVQAFVAKLLFFAAYIVVFLKNDLVQPKLFVVCFAVFYFALHMTEAYGLHRMQDRARRIVPR